MSVSVTYTDAFGEHTVTDGIDGANNGGETVGNVDDAGSVTILGTAEQGQTLTTSLEDADGITGTPVYTWSVDGVAVINPNTDQSTFTLTQNEVGKSVSVSVTYTDAFGEHTLTDAIDKTNNGGETVGDVNDAPTVTASNLTARVSEEGLSQGLVDDSGQNSGDDTTNATVVIGTLAFTDLDGDTLSATITAPTEIIKSGGETIVWSGAGTTLLTGGLNDGTPVVKVEITDEQTGAYKVTLLAPIDHSESSVEDTLTLGFNVAVTDGSVTTNTTLNVVVEDDKPYEGHIEKSVEIPEQSTNLLFMVDTSGSMAWDAATGKTQITTVERMELLLTSMKKVIESYAELGPVRIQISTFNNNDSAHQDNWFTVDEALAFIGNGKAGSRDPSLNPGGGTNYDQALADGESAFSQNGKLESSSGVAVANVAYFLSDGQPTTGGGITGSEITDWTDFLTTNDISAYAVGFGSGLTSSDRSYLDPIAYDGRNESEREGIIVADSTSLTATLLSTVRLPLAGTVFGELDLDGLGADGGYFQTVTLDETTYTYDIDNNQITNDQNGNVIAGSVLSITTGINGDLKLDLNSGKYEYQPDTTLAQGETRTESLAITAIDGDGDTSSGTATLYITRAAKEVAVTSNIYVGYDEIAVNSLEAGWINDVYDAGTNEVVRTNTDSDAYNDKLEWGIPASGSEKSGYELVDNSQYTSDTNSNIYTGELIKLADFTHNNFPVSSSVLDKTQMVVTLNVVINGVETPVSLTIDLEHTETPNDGVDPRDIITLPAQTATISVDGESYTVNIVGFQNSAGEYVETIYTDESASNAFEIYGSIRATDPLQSVSGSVLDAAVVNDPNSEFSWTTTTSPYGDFVGNEDGSYTFTISEATRNALQPGESIETEFNYTFTDANGNVENSSVTVKIGGYVNIEGTSGDDTLVGGDTNDLLVAGAGNDSLNGGAGDDVFIDGENIDGGTGYDTLLFTAQNIDLANLENISNVESIDLGNGDKTLSISLDDVLTMTDSDNSLVIEGDKLDTLNVDTDGWDRGVTTSNSNDTTTFEYTKGSDSITLTVDDQIDTTGM